MYPTTIYAQNFLNAVLIRFRLLLQMMPHLYKNATFQNKKNAKCNEISFGNIYAFWKCSVTKSNY